MRHRAVIYSESDCDIIGRRRGDSDEIIIKQEKTLQQIEEANEDKISSQLYYMNNYYNNETQGNEAPSTELIIEYIKETIISSDKSRALFKGIKKQKRRNSLSLTQELSDKQIIDDVVLSDDTNMKYKRLTDKSSSTKFSNGEDNTLQIPTKNIFGFGLKGNFACVRDAISQNINIEDKIRLMLVSNGNDLIMKSLLLYILNEEWTSDSHLLTIKNKIIQFTPKKTLMLTLYNTQLALHNKPFSKVYYPLMDSCFYFIDNTQEMSGSLRELNTFIQGISSMERRMPLVLIVNSDTSRELIEGIKAINYPITVYNINEADEFNKFALKRTLTNIMLRRPIKHKQKTEEDDYFGCFDDLNCESGYRIENNNCDDDNDDNSAKLVRCKSYAF